MFDLNMSLLCFILYAAACRTLISGLCVTMCSSSFSLSLKSSLVALSRISTFSALKTCVGCSFKCVWIALSFLGLRCSLTLSYRILLVLPIYDCLQVSHVNLYTTCDWECFSLMLSLNGNILPISLGALNAILKST